MAARWLFWQGFPGLSQAFVAVSLDILINNVGHTAPTTVRKTLQWFLSAGRVCQVGILPESVLGLVLIIYLFFPNLTDRNERAFWFAEVIRWQVPCSLCDRYPIKNNFGKLRSVLK